jgi:hypothetical protein
MNMDRVVARFTGRDYIEALRRRDHAAMAKIKAEFARLNKLADAAGGWKRFNEINGADPYELASNKPR